MRIAGGTAKRITKRIINFIFVIWGVVTLSFCLQVFTGTDPAEMIVRTYGAYYRVCFQRPDRIYAKFSVLCDLLSCLCSHAQ